MRKRRLRIAAAMHDGHLSLFIKTLEASHSRVESVLVVDLAQLGRAYADLGPQPVVGVVRIGHQRVEAIISAGQFQHHQNTFGHVARRMRFEQGQACGHTGHGLHQAASGESRMIVLSHFCHPS